MQSLLDIKVQKLFLVTILLKVLSSFIGWWFQMPWIFGFFIPLLFMAAYVVLGLKRRDHDVSDEKFADSCYYLGFIFTISSIIFSLFDLPNIGTKMQEIAVRFGAAMVSTVVGLVVRVYLVSFKKDVADAIKDAEEAVIDASQQFREHLVIANERLRDFHSAVDIAAKETVERVRAQLEAMAKDHSEKLTEFFDEVREGNQAAFKENVAEVRSATMRLTKSVDTYSEAMRANINSIELKVNSFADSVAGRLQNMTFPDDYFVKRLAAPLQQVRDDASALSGGVRQATETVGEASKVLGIALRQLQEKASSTDEAMEGVLRLATQQRAVLDAAQGQLGTLERIEGSLLRFDTLLDQVTVQLQSAATVSTDVMSHVQRVVDETSAARVSLQQSLGAVADKIESNTQVTARVAERFSQGANASDEIAVGWQANARANTELAQQLREISAAERGATGVLQGLGAGAAKVLERVEAAVTELHAVATQLRSVDSVARPRVTPDIVLPRTPVAPPHAGSTVVVPTIADLQPQRPSPTIAAAAATGIGITAAQRTLDEVSITPAAPGAAAASSAPLADGGTPLVTPDQTS